MAQCHCRHLVSADIKPGTCVRAPQLCPLTPALIVKNVGGLASVAAQDLKLIP